MEEIVNALENLAKKEMIDIVAVFSPILLSVVAIIVSIFSLIKQNKTMLFELKHRVIASARSFLVLEENIYKNKELKFIIFAFNGIFELEKDEQKLSNNRERIVSKLIAMKNEIQMGEFFVKKGGYVETLRKIINEAQEILINALDGFVENDLLENFHKHCEEFNCIYLKRIIKQIM